MNKTQASETITVFAKALGESSPEIRDVWSDYGHVYTNFRVNGHTVFATIHDVDNGIIRISVLGGSPDFETIANMTIPVELALTMTTTIVNHKTAKQVA